MNRAYATSLLEELLRRVTAGDGGWPLELVDEVRVFGSYLRGALQSHDIDVDVDYSPDERWHEEALARLLYGRDPEVPLRRALIGTARSIQLTCRLHKEAPEIEMLTLWRRGDTLEQALDRLHAIRPDSTAGRAERDAMLPAFEGLDRWLDRPVRGRLAQLVEAGAIAITQVELPDAELDDLRDEDAQWAIERRWADDSPLRRAAIAALAYLEARGISPQLVHLHGQDIAPSTPEEEGNVTRVVRAETPYIVSLQCRYLRAMPRLLIEAPGGAWIEIPRPTRRQPLLALWISALDLDVLAAEARKLAGF